LRSAAVEIADFERAGVYPGPDRRVHRRRSHDDRVGLVGADRAATVESMGRIVDDHQ
jgi:hypothetical protein